VFGRRSSPTATSEEVGAGRELKRHGKGRPTPKRREAERLRRQRSTAPRDRKEALRQARQRNRQERARTRAALVSGDERNLPARDRGPVRRLVRDIVDGRRTVAEFFLYIAFTVLLLSFVRVPVIQIAGTMLWLVSMLLIVADSFLIARRVRREIAERYPGENAKGAVTYALLRSMQIRRLRLPPPRVRPGQPLPSDR
jgi:hypothetical protein